VLLTATALSLGFLHGLGADHLMAIAALAVRTDRAPEAARHQPVRVAVRFALGHALVLLLGAGAVLLLGWQIPELVERTGEIVGGTLLIVMGAFTLWVVAANRLYGHVHPPGWMHWHVHLGRRERHPAPDAHSAGAGLLGAVFAVSGLRALTLLAPELSSGGAGGSLVTLLYLVGVFAVGIVLSMSLFGVVLSQILGSPRLAAAVGRGAALVTALASIALGTYWVMA
jgi:nickel/cobalt transporter (NicO) family protein